MSTDEAGIEIYLSPALPFFPITQVAYDNLNLVTGTSSVGPCCLPVPGFSCIIEEQAVCESILGGAVLLGADPICPTEDCDGDGVADACQIALGSAADYNGNGIPDACDLPGDGDGDGAITLDDWPYFVDCMTGPCEDPVDPACEPLPPQCSLMDLDGDGDVDLDEAAELQRQIGAAP